MDDTTLDEMRQLEDEHWWFVGKRLLVEALLAPVLDGTPRILDVGCGTGGVLAQLAGRTEPYGVDRSHRALGYCRERGLARVVCATGDQLPFVPGRFDVVLLLDVLEHFADERALLGAATRLLRPGGRLLVSVPAFQALWSDHDVVLHHVRRYTAGRLRQALAAADLRIERLTYTNVVALPPAAVVRGLLQRIGLWQSGGTDFRMHAPWVNRALVAAYRTEARALARGWRLPAGLAVAALAVAPP